MSLIVEASQSFSCCFQMYLQIDISNNNGKTYYVYMFTGYRKLEDTAETWMCEFPFETAQVTVSDGEVDAMLVVAQQGGPAQQGGAADAGEGEAEDGEEEPNAEDIKAAKKKARDAAKEDSK